MAIVSELKNVLGRTLHVHPTKVACSYSVCDLGEGRKLLQLDTRGSSKREIPGKISQTLQFDEVNAHALWKLIGSEFGFSR